jgi:enterochelin esterase-like enzyme
MTGKLAILLMLALPVAARAQEAGPGPQPAAPALPDVPHGTLHYETYTTKYVKGLPANEGNFVVYTPANYDPARKPGYPTLYLLHGWGDDADAWVKKGHADVDLDRMIANGRVVPMVVVMPLGYGDISFLSNGFEVWRDQEQISNNVNRFSETLLEEIVPKVETTYDVAKDRDQRAIAGLSMGGLEALTIGLRHPEMFAWIGGFSSAIFPVAGQDLTGLDAKKEDLKLLWISCGTDDDLLSINRIFEMHMKDAGLPVKVVETPGPHAWGVWRNNFNHFVPLLFKDAPAGMRAGN